MKKALLLFAILLCTLKADAQFTFQKAIGYTGSDDAHCIVQTTDGGYVMCGVTDSVLGNTSSSNNLYVVKVNNAGHIQWSRVFDSLGLGNSIIQTTDGGYVILPSDDRFSLLKLDNGGNVQWMKSIAAGYAGRAYDIIQTADGGFAACGVCPQIVGAGLDVFVMKLDAGGNLQWARAIGGPNNDYGHAIIQTLDGDLAIAGKTQSFGTAGDVNFYVLKLSGTGALKWAKTIGGPYGDEGRDIVQNADGSLAVCGMAYSFNTIGTTDIYVVKLDINGNLLWNRVINRHIQYSFDDANSIIATADGGFVVGGTNMIFGPGGDVFYLAKLDAQGNFVWGTSVGGSGSEWGRAFAKTNDQGFIACGNTTSFNYNKPNIYIIKYDQLGYTCGSITREGSAQNVSGVIDSGGSTISSTATLLAHPAPSGHPGGGVDDLCNTAGIHELGAARPQVFPNPFSGQTTIALSAPIQNGTLTLYNSVGQIVSRQEHVSGRSFVIRQEDLPTGMYSLRVFQENNLIAQERIIIQP